MAWPPARQPRATARRDGVLTGLARGPVLGVRHKHKRPKTEVPGHLAYPASPRPAHLHDDPWGAGTREGWWEGTGDVHVPRR